MKMGGQSSKAASGGEEADGEGRKRRREDEDTPHKSPTTTAKKGRQRHPKKKARPAGSLPSQILAFRQILIFFAPPHQNLNRLQQSSVPSRCVWHLTTCAASPSPWVSGYVHQCCAVMSMDLLPRKQY